MPIQAASQAWARGLTLLKLAIEDGVATADFPKEMRAYGGSLRAKLIRDQLTATLTQFARVNEARMAIEGQTEGVLEP